MRSPISPRVMPNRPGVNPGAFFNRGGSGRGVSDFFGRTARSVGGTVVRAGKSALMSAAQNISQSLEPQVESDGINVTKVERIVENKVNRLVPKISERVEQQVNTFDPNQMLASIFRNGLDGLVRFQQNLQSIMQPLQKTFDFIFQSRDILVKLINQLATAAKNLGSSKSPGMGLRGLKTLALAVTAAFAAKITWDQIQKANAEGPPPQGGEISGTPPPMGGGVEQQQALSGGLSGEDVASFNAAVNEFSAILEGIRESMNAGRDPRPGSAESSGTQIPELQSTSQSTSPTMGGPSGISLPDAPPEIKALMDSVSAGEGDVNAIQGQKDHGLNLEEMTIEEAFQAGEGMRGQGDTTTGAIGAYQFHPDYHRQTAIDAGLDLNKDKFTKSNQDRMMRAYMTKVYGIQGGKGGEAGMVESIRAGNLMTDVIPKLSVDMGWPSLPGGSQPNVHTANFEATYNARYQHYSTAAGLTPSQESANLRSDASRQISQAPEQFMAEEDGSITVLPINAGGEQNQGPQYTNIPDGEGASIPFLPPFDTSNIHTMYSRIVYNIVDV